MSEHAQQVFNKWVDMVACGEKGITDLLNELTANLERQAEQDYKLDYPCGLAVAISYIVKTKLLSK